MSSRKQKRNNVINDRRSDIIDNNMLEVDDINPNTKNPHQQPTSLLGATTYSGVFRGQSIQILEHNGQLYVSLQDDHLIQSNINTMLLCEIKCI